VQPKLRLGGNGPVTHSDYREADRAARCARHLRREKYDRRSIHRNDARCGIRNPQLPKAHARAWGRDHSPTRLTAE